MNVNCPQLSITATGYDSPDGLSQFQCWLTDDVGMTWLPCDLCLLNSKGQPIITGGVTNAINHVRRHLERLDIIDPTVIAKLEADRGWLDLGHPPPDLAL